MLDQKEVFHILQEHGVNFYTGVPDSHLNGFCNYALEHCPKSHVIAANEGNAVGIAAGHYLATEEVPLVYMQNSGQGNTINPLVSLADEHVYAIPMLILVGWRGQPGTGDWAQHQLQGEITPKLFELMDIPYAILSDNMEDFRRIIDEAVVYCKDKRKSFGLIAPKGVMAGEKANNVNDVYPMSREEAIEITVEHMPSDTIYAATTGRATRELFFLRERRGETLRHDYLNVGSMGHASSVALGIALEQPERHVVVLDGDSAVIMHMGALTMASAVDAPNLMHIVLNNGAHESVGGQPSVGHKIDLTKIAEACGYETVHHPVTSKEELIGAIDSLRDCGRASFIDCRIHKGLRGALPPLDFSHRGAIDELIEELHKGKDN